MVTLSSGGPNLLGSSWQQGFAAVGSNAFTFPDGSVPGLGFSAQDPPDVDTFYQAFATVAGKSYTYSFDYANNTRWQRPLAFEVDRDGQQRSGSLDLGHVASRLCGSWHCRLSVRCGAVSIA
jgi:hypothetical protein